MLTAKHATNLSPDLWEQTMMVGHALADQSRHPASERSQGMHGIAIVYEIRGRVKEAIAQWKRTWAFNGAPASDLDAYEFMYGIPRVLGVPYDSAVVRHWYNWLSAVPDSLTTDQLSPFLAGLYAATHGVGKDTEHWLHQYDVVTTRYLEDGDSAGARRGNESKRMIRAYLAESRGDTSAVLRELRRGIAVYPGDAGTEQLMGFMLRFDLVRPLIAVKDYTSAQPYLGSFERWGTFPDYFRGPVELYRGQVAEGLGDVEGAKTHYANLARWWKDCEPDLAPVREKARKALARLSAEPVSTQ